MLVRGVRGLNSKEREACFQPAKELQFIQDWIEPAIGDAIVHIKGPRVMPLMMLRFQHEPFALQPARKSGRALLVGPLVKLVGRYSRHRH